MSKYQTPAIAEIDRQGWSIRALARELGVAHVYLWQCVTGRRVPAFKFALLVALRLGVSVEDIFPGVSR